MVVAAGREGSNSGETQRTEVGEDVQDGGEEGLDCCQCWWRGCLFGYLCEFSENGPGERVAQFSWQ